MEKAIFEVLKNDKEELRLQFDTIDQGFLNFIKDAIWKQSGVEQAGFRIDHPEVGKPVFVIKTKGKKAKDVWNSAVDSLSKDLSKLEKDVKKLK